MRLRGHVGIRDQEAPTSCQRGCYFSIAVWSIAIPSPALDCYPTRRACAASRRYKIIPSRSRPQVRSPWLPPESSGPASRPSFPQGPAAGQRRPSAFHLHPLHPYKPKTARVADSNSSHIRCGRLSWGQAPLPNPAILEILTGPWSI